MKTVAVEDSTYAKLSKLKTAVNGSRVAHLTFSELLEEIIRRPLAILLLPDALGKALDSITDYLGENDNILGLILFGSVARGNYESNSDVDLFVIVKENSTKIFDFVEKSILKTEMESSETLIKNNLPAQFSPFICSEDELDFVRPVFFDISDTGVILYDKGRKASKFVDRYLSLHHRRDFSENGEILTW